MPLEPIYWLNGEFRTDARISLSFADAGLVWGAVVVDRCRTFHRKPYGLSECLRRFRYGCEQAAVPQPRDDAEIERVISRLLDSTGEKGDEFSILLFATPGTSAAGPTLLIRAEPIDPARYAPWMTEGAILQPMIDPGSIFPGIKHRSRLGWWKASREVGPGREPLFVSTDTPPWIRETPTANFLAVMGNNSIVTPSSDVLDGLACRMLQTLARDAGLNWQDRPLSLSEVESSASECLLTNTTVCLAPVARVGLRPFPAENGPIFRRLIEDWSLKVGFDILSQFRVNR